MKQYRLDMKGVAVEIIESGGSQTPVFLFHGNSMSAAVFSSLVAANNNQTHRLIAVSLPGHGDTEFTVWNTHQPVTIAAIGQFIKDVIDAFNVQEYFLVGQSVSGHAILQTLDQHQSALGLVLLSAPPVSLETLAQALKPDPTNGLLFAGHLTESEAIAFANSLFVQLSDTDRAEIAQSVQRTEPMFRQQLGHSLALGEIKDEIHMLRDSHLPTALMMGSDDQFINLDYLANAAIQPLFHGRVTIFNQAGHLFNLEQTQAFKVALLEMLDQLAQDHQQS